MASIAKRPDGTYRPRYRDQNGKGLQDLKHFYAGGFIGSGRDVVTVQRALGHWSAAITLGVYSHLWPPPRTARAPQRVT